jgi:putative methyltransferase (TIGR04325 family)
MNLVSLASRSFHWLVESPPVLTLRRRSFDREFATARQAHMFRGVYRTFEEARASAPPSKPIGYDIPEAAAMYRERTRRVYPSDYPVMFWLEKLFAAGARRIVDVGGHIGVSYYAYQRYVRYPADLRWVVYDVPAVVASGREWAADNDALRQLAFSSGLDVLREADVVMASGSLQYLEETIDELLQRNEARPRWVLINLLPVHAEKSYFTLQSIGVSFCPYRIYGRRDLEQGLSKLGYVLRDVWENAEKGCHVAFDREHSLDRYYGFLFEAGTATSA